MASDGDARRLAALLSEHTALGATVNVQHQALLVQQAATATDVCEEVDERVHALLKAKAALFKREAVVAKARAESDAALAKERAKCHATLATERAVLAQERVQVQAAHASLAEEQPQNIHFI